LSQTARRYLDWQLVHSAQSGPINHSLPAGDDFPLSVDRCPVISWTSLSHADHCPVVTRSSGVAGKGTAPVVDGESGGLRGKRDKKKTGIG